MVESTEMAMASQGLGSSSSSSTIELNQVIQARSLQERVAIVTGSSRGIGREIALHLALLGARIVVNYSSNLAQAESVAAQINSSSCDGGNPRAIVVRADVSDPTQVKSLFDEAEKAFNSPVHIMVNSAAIADSKHSYVANNSLEDFDLTFRLGHASYTASKAAVEAMLKILAKELKGTGFTANCVAPGPIATDMYFAGRSEEQVKKAIEECPLGRLRENKDVAPLVGFLASDAGEWVNGQVVRVNGVYV